MKSLFCRQVDTFLSTKGYKTHTETLLITYGHFGNYVRTRWVPNTDDNDKDIWIAFRVPPNVGPIVVMSMLYKTIKDEEEIRK